ncbi:siroheme biosynthesis protein Met8p [Trichomonascus vanleenenianus]|uniref:bifunctional precorrin-2 dehydrogenase/sirohydrochlorin ferrochelatase MET8 n=1 Tax=Trichomonascus vanleenenianus TaxID=2268995 RepID=UPI003ECA5DCB
MSTKNSLIVAWQLENKPVLVIGGGEVAKGRIEALERAGAKVTVVAPEIDEDIRPSSNVELVKRGFSLDDITEEYAMVMSAVDDRVVSRQVYEKCHALRIPVNVADMPEQCDFYFGSMINRGPLQVMVSTNGGAPRLARRIRTMIEDRVDELGVEGAIANMAKLRQALREKTVPKEGDQDAGYDPSTIRKRMKWISQICDDWTFKQMAELTDEEIGRVVEKYPAPKVDYDEIKS